MEENRYTDRLPTDPGIYWNSTGAPEDDSIIVVIRGNRGNLIARRYDSNPHLWLESFGPYWAGPICKPEGSETIVVESEQMKAVSFPIK